AISNIVKGRPTNVQVMGPVGIFSLSAEILKLGTKYFLLFLSLISIYVALFNILPIPALDGGKLLFLGIEKFKGKPVNPKIEQNITAVFFALLVVLAIWVTIKDITRLF
ncbi:MAG: RIP metalloprotease RseP, partial [Candidatus Nealsonbacteria bacterium CG_4_10_14_0_8_um_filter_35_10]